jgi:uncharacterized protein YjbJ (UPF0337 family)
MFKANDSVWNKIAGNWKQFSGEIRRKWGLLTDDDIEQIHGHREILMGKLQERYGYAQEDAQRKVEDWERSLGL